MADRRNYSYEREREAIERNSFATPQNNTHIVDTEPATFTFPPSVPTTHSQIENIIRSDVVTRIVAEKVDQVLGDPRLLEGILNSPQFQQVLFQFFASPQGAEVLKKIQPQSAPSMPLAHRGALMPVPMVVDNHIQGPPAIMVFSWNVLAPSFAAPKFYGYCSQESLNINFRFNKIVEILVLLKPDVICLQEMEANLHTTLAEILRDYKGTFANHEGKADGCSLFIKNS